MMLDILEELNGSAIKEKYRQKDPRGTRPYAPKMRVGLLLYGYSVGIRSSRKLEKATCEDIPFRVLAAGNHPDHTRISEFRRKHLDELEDLFLQVFQICQRMGLVELSDVALDGTKVQAKADCASGQAKSHESKRERKRSLALAEKWDEEAEQLKEEADEQIGAEAKEAETPEGMPKHRPKWETDGTPKPKAQRNFTDPDSRIMEKGGEFLQGFGLSAPC